MKSTPCFPVHVGNITEPRPPGACGAGEAAPFHGAVRGGGPGLPGVVAVAVLTDGGRMLASWQDWLRFSPLS